MNNNQSVYLADNRGIGGQTRHVNVEQYFLWELKDDGLLWVKHILGDENDANIFTKNLPGPTFKKHV